MTQVDLTSWNTSV